MTAAWPPGNRVENVHVGVTDELDVYGMITFSIEIWIGFG